MHQILLLRERAKEITDIKCQTAVELTAAKIRTKMDFSYVVIASDERIWVEAKGVETERWRMIEKLWRFYGPGKLEIWKGRFEKPTITDLIDPTIKGESR